MTDQDRLRYEQMGRDIVCRYAPEEVSAMLGRLHELNEMPCRKPGFWDSYVNPWRDAA
jgi:hypothetical protein